MVVEAVTSLVEWVGTSIYEGGKYVLNYVPQHFKYYMPGAILMLSLLFMLLIVVLITVIQSEGGSIGIGTGSVSGGFGADGAGRLGQGGQGGNGTGGGVSGTVTETTGATATTLTDLCGNGMCQNYKTTAKHAYKEAIIPDYCATADIIYDIPDYCQNGEQLRRFIIYGASWQDPRTYPSAWCMEEIYAVVNERCSVSNNSLYYTENSQNCPEDCTESYECYYDYTCNDNPSNCGNYAEMECCSPGTAHEYECEDLGKCESSDPPIPLSKLKHTPVHCGCTSDAGCAGDFGGPVCCTTGPHTGFCYRAIDCTA